MHQLREIASRGVEPDVTYDWLGSLTNKLKNNDWLKAAIEEIGFDSAKMKHLEEYLGKDRFEKILFVMAVGSTEDARLSLQGDAAATQQEMKG